MDQDNKNYGRDQNIFNQPRKVVVNIPAEGKRPPVYDSLLRRVNDEVQERLAKNLHKAVNGALINLGKELQPEQVSNPWSMEVWVQERPPEILPAGTSITEVFEYDNVVKKLLILGEAGSGKTTTILELSQDLVHQATQTASAPIPVLVDLSSWKDPAQSIFDWLVLELNSKYKLEQASGQQGLINNQLLPLLDGLDEVAPALQESCATALNQLLMGDLDQLPIGFVVCCRLRAYNQIVKPKLSLKNSVVLQPLSEEQVEAYLRQFSLNDVWTTAQNSASLLALLKKPLFLSVFGFIAVNQGFDVHAWQQRNLNGDSFTFFFDCYWTAVMERSLVRKALQDKGFCSQTYGEAYLPSCRVIRRSLVFVALMMEKESLTEFQIEKIQPSHLLEDRERQEYFYCFSFLFGLVTGFIFLLAEIIFSLGKWIILLIAFFVGFLFGAVGVSSIFNQLKLLDTIHPSNKIQILFSTIFLSSTRKSFLKWLAICFFVVAIYALLLKEFFQGFTYGLTILVMMSILEALRTEPEAPIRANQGIENSRNNMLRVTTVCIIFAVPLKILLELLLGSQLSSKDLTATASLAIIIFIGLGFSESGGRDLLQHIALRIVMVKNGYAPYRYDRLLDYCTERLLLQRIGGRYRFMHKHLQEHFSEMEMPSKP